MPPDPSTPPESAVSLSQIAEVYAALGRRLPDTSWGALLALAFWAAQLYFILTVQRLGLSMESLPAEPPAELSLAMIPLLAVALAAVAFYYFCVYRFHKLACTAPGWKHPVSPGRAVGFHFIPFFNLYWVFRWPAELGRFLRWCMPNPGINWQLGAAYIGCQLLGFLSPAASVFATMGLLGYIRWRMKIALDFKAAALAGRVTPEAFSA